MLDSGIISNILAFLGTLVGVLTALYIAYRHGAFRKAYLFVSCGLPLVSENQKRWVKKHILNGRKTLWAIAYGVPNTEASSYLIYVPFVLKNKSDIAIKNIYVQFESLLDFDPSKLWSKGIKENNILGIKGHISQARGKYKFEVKVPMLTPRSHLTLCFPIYIEKQIFTNSKSDSAKNTLVECNQDEFIVAEIDCYYSSESLSPEEFKTNILIALLKDKEDLTNKVDKPLQQLYEKDCPNPFKGVSGWVYKPVPWSFWYSLMYPSCRKKKPFLIAKSKYVRHHFDPMLFVEDFEKTGYMPGLIIFNQ